MDTGTDSGIATEDEARRQFLQATVFKRARFLATIERASDDIYTVVIPKAFDGKEHGILEFRRWTHQQANRFYKLPFIDKFGSKTLLTDDEKEQFHEFQKLMVLDSVLDEGKWKELAESSKPFVSMVFDLIAKVSGITKAFDEDLSEFMDSDYGLTYGLIWFQLFGKTPGEVALLSEMDYKAVMAWIQRWVEKVKPK